MRFLRLLFILIFCMATLGAFAQKGKLKRANRFYRDLSYQSAIEAYLEILDKRDVAEAKINLADCYRHVNNWADAEYWYGQVVRLPEGKPIHKLYYGMALQANNKPDMAKQWFEEYTAMVPDDVRGRLLLEACDANVMDRLLKAGNLYKVVNVSGLNTSYDDFGATYFDDGIVFSSERDRGVAFKRVHSWTGHPFLELFFSKRKLFSEENLEYTYGKAEKYSSKINSKFHDGPVSFSRDFKEVFFTRNNIYKGKTGRDDDGIIRLKVYSSRRQGDSWGEFQSLPFNSDEYSVAHPSLSADGGRLYFSSDMPGGFGGMDLYVSFLENGRWSPPVNLGPNVNTEGNELFPFIHDDGTLYFSSNGHTGLGGLDIYYSNEVGGAWTTVVNLGYPINTSNDDFSFVLNTEKTHGYFSSNRAGGSGGDDIYSFTRFAVNVEVLVFDKNSGDPIESATVTTGYEPVPSLKTGVDGKVKLELPLGQSYTFVGSKELYEDASEVLSTRNWKPGESITVKIALQQPYRTSIIGLVRDPEGKLIRRARVILESNCGQATQEMYTDDNGGYTFDLLPNCCYKLKVIQDGYVLHEEAFCNELASKDDPIIEKDVVLNPIKVEPEKPEINKAIALEHIYYNFDKSSLRDDATAGLGNLLQMMKDNPSLVVEIGSHTDARGSIKYNERLSARRAESVVNWLVKNGISRSRVKSKGYGETVPTNNCFDKVPCTEEQHQRNRRTEFKIIGTVNGVKDPSSTAPGAIKVDACKKCPF